MGILGSVLTVWVTFDPASLVLAVAAMVAIFRFKLGMVPVLLGSVVISAAVALVR